MRILIVDDELVSRTKLETLMGPMGACMAVDCGAKAISAYEQALTDGQAFDLVMLDIDMPDIQGQEVLKRFRDIENFGPHRATVVMVTAQSDQDHVITCLKTGCDEYIAKPFNRDTIIEKLLNLGLIHTEDASSDPLPSDFAKPSKTSDMIFSEVSKSLSSGQLTLPVPPKIGIQLRELVKNNADLDQLALLLKQDVVLATKLIRVANSALYRGLGTVQTIEQAVNRLGFKETEQVVTALVNRQLFNTDQRKYNDALLNLWQHSLASAYGAEILARSLAQELAIDPFCAGLFHDIGALALIHIISQMESRGRYAEDIDSEALSETIVNYHAMFGAKVLEIWEFDIEYIRTTLSHNNLLTAESLTTELLVVHFGNLVAKSLGYTTDDRPLEIDLAESQSAKALKLDAPRIATLKEKVEACMVKSSGMMT